MKKCNRIVFASASPILGGADIIFHSVYGIIDEPKLLILNKKLNNQVDLAPQPYFINFYQLERKVKSIFFFIIHFFSSVFGLFKLLKKKDLVIANDFLILVYILPIKIFLSQEVIFYCHSAFKKSHFNQQITSKFVNHLSTQIIVPSKFLKDNLVSLGIAADKITVIYNGIEDLATHESPAPKSKQPVKVGLFGEITDLKGQDDFVSAIHLLNTKKSIKAEGILVGRLRDEAFYKKIENNFRQDFKNGSIKYLGLVKRDEAIVLMEKCDLIICASKYGEVLPTVLIEAMSLSKPVIGTKVGGIPEIIKHRKNGLLVNPNSPEELAEGIEYIVNNDLANQYGLNGRKLFLTRFNKTKFAEAINRSITLKPEVK